MRPHNIIVDSRTLPKPEELYEGGLKRTPWGWIYAHTIEPAKEWVADHGIATTAAAVVAVGAITASIILPNALGKEARPISQTTQANTQPGIVIDASSIYRSQVRDALLQDVPELANYRSALDYTTQRVVDMKNVYGLSLDQVRAPVAKWVNANIEWDKIGERLVGFNDNPGFIPDSLFNENGTFDSAQKEENYKLVTPARSSGQRLSSEILTSLFTGNTKSIADGHGQIWADIHDPNKMEEYLATAHGRTYVPYENHLMDKHKQAILEQGTFEDKAHYALIGRATKYPIGNEELTRNEVPLAMILAVGGDARIEANYQVWDVSAYKGPHKMRPDQSDRQLAFRKSTKLKSYLASNQQTYGTPLDPDYIEPALPSIEIVKALAGYVSPETSVKLLGIAAVTKTMPNGTEQFLYGTDHYSLKN